MKNLINLDLNLYKNGIDDNGVSKLLEGISKLQNLATLNLFKI